MNQYRTDFEKRFAALLAYQFRNFDLKMAMEILSPRLTSTAATQASQEDEMDQETGEQEGTKLSRVL